MIFIFNDRMLFINEEVIVPDSLRKDTLEIIHGAHFGVMVWM